MRLAHPEVPTCDSCQEWAYDPKTWKPYSKGGKAVARTPSNPPPCYACPKSRDGKPNPGADLNGKAFATVELYFAAKAGLAPPADPIVQQNFALLAWVEDQVSREQARLATGKADLVTALLRGLTGAS